MKKITLIRLVRDNDLNVIGYVFKNDHNDEIEVEASEIKNVILNTTVVTQGLGINTDGEVVLSKKFIDHGMTISGDEPYKSKIENRNTRYALQLSLDDMGYNINNVLHLRELNTCKIKSFDSVSEMLKAFKHISKFKRSFEKVLIEEAREIKHLDMVNNIEQYKDRLLTFYGNCYTYFFLTTETRVCNRRWEHMLLKDGNKHNIIVKNNSRVHRNDINDDYSSTGILGIAVEEGRGLAMYGNPEPLVVKIFSSEYKNNEQLTNFVEQYYNNDILVDDKQEGYVLVIKRLVEIMCNL